MMNVIRIHDIRKLPARRLQSPPPGATSGTLYVYTAPTLLGGRVYIITLWEPHNNGDDDGDQGRIHHNTN